MKRSVRANLLLTLTALIWGAAFVAQDVAADSLGSFTFNGLRMALAAMAMLPVIAALDRKARKTGQDTSWRGMTPAQRRTLLTGGTERSSSAASSNAGGVEAVTRFCCDHCASSPVVRSVPSKRSNDPLWHLPGSAVMTG